MSVNNDLSEFSNDKKLSSRTRCNLAVDPEESSSVKSESYGINKINYSNGLTQYSILSNKTFRASQQTITELNSGLYTVKYDHDIGIYFHKEENHTDEILEFPDSNLNDIVEEIQNFWKQGDLFAHYNFLHSRGYMFYGPAGSGKTMLIKLLIKKITENNGIIFKCDNPEIMITGLKQFREIEPDRACIVLFEDIDAIISKFGEEDILSYLDGEDKINKVLNVATTNYPEKLDRRIVARPRRFDRVIKIDMPNENIRRLYFIKKLKISEEEVKKWVDKTEGFSFAGLADLVISVKCLNNEFEESVSRIKEMFDNKKGPSSDEYNENSKFKGFGIEE